MKIAYIIHGHSRTWRECYQSFFDNIFSVAPGDIFIHTWDRINAKTGSHWNGWAYRLAGDIEEISSKTTDVDGMIKAYNPKYMVVETDLGAERWANELHVKYGSSIHHPHVALKNYFYGQHKIFNIAKTFDSYDKYIFIRPDLKFTAKLDISLLENPNVVVPSCDGVSFTFDIWKIADTEQSTICTDFYNHMDEHFYTHPRVSVNDHSYCIENCIFDYWRTKNITAFVPDHSMNLHYELVRISKNTY